MLWLVSTALAVPDWEVVGGGGPPPPPPPPPPPCTIEVDEGAGPGGCDAVCPDGVDLQCGDTSQVCEGATACVDQCDCTMYLSERQCEIWGYDPQFPTSIHVEPIDLDEPPDCTVRGTGHLDDDLRSCCTIHHEIGHAECYEGKCGEANQENGGELTCLLEGFDALCSAATGWDVYACQSACTYIAQQRLAALRDQCYCDASGGGVTQAECAACDATCGDADLADLALPPQCWAEYSDWYQRLDRGRLCDDLKSAHPCSDYQGPEPVIVPL